ncbi:hypothetical protein AgCh_017448 [Apium graveolens]
MEDCLLPQQRMWYPYWMRRHKHVGTRYRHTKAEAANDQLTKKLEERKELVNTLFMKHQSEKQGTKKTYKKKLHVYKKGNIQMVESRRK